MTAQFRSKQDEVWLITGCSSGLGRLIAEEALRRGDRVVATARRPEGLAHWAASWPQDRLLVRQLDVTDDQDTMERCVNETIEAFGTLDVLVNNAGRVHIGAVEEVNDADLKAFFDLHVFGPTRLVRAALPAMRRQGRGTIVQMSTMGSFFITPGFSTYTSSKAALEGLSATLATELAPLGIRVLIVEPGAHRTPVFAAAQESMAERLDAYEATVGVTRTFLAEADGRQPGDPQTACRVIVDTVKQDGNLPLRLPLGGDAVTNITAALDAIGTEIDAQAALARSTTYTP